MGQITTGWRAILNNPMVYESIQRLMGSKRGTATFCREYIRPFSGMSILDIGCGTASIVSALPDDVNYYGYDASQLYIDRAQKLYEGKGTFTCALVEEMTLANLPTFDLVLAKGLLHHLDDTQSEHLIGLAFKALKEGGRLVTLDNCYIPNQNPIARFLISKDRGQHVRAPEQYQNLVKSHFLSQQLTVTHKKFPPYTLCIVEGKKL